jgi:glycosyltransferase involved in cell wall biosynthesis
MTVFVNGRFATQPVSGVQRYAGEIVRALDARAGAGGEDYVLLSPGDAPDAGLTNIEQRRVGGRGGHGWDQLAFARAARGGVALSLAMSGPLLHRRQLVVLHDAAVHRRPEHFSRRYALGHRWLERGLAGRARIATVSEFSRAELADVLGIEREGILVAPNGADHARCRIDDEACGRFGLTPRRFFVMIGNLSANKNVAVARRALARIADQDVRLIVIGAAASCLTMDLKSRADERVWLVGRIDDETVAGLLREACALVFASRYEGFGLPLLEAMASGCPVMASDCAAAVEVCDGSAEHFAVDDDGALATLMERALADDGRWRRERLAAGFKRALDFRWAESAAVLATACSQLENAQ